MVYLYFIIFVLSSLITFLYIIFKDDIFQKLLYISFLNFICSLHVLFSIYSDINEPDVVDALNIPIIKVMLLIYSCFSVLMFALTVFVKVKNNY